MLLPRTQDSSRFFKEAPLHHLFLEEALALMVWFLDFKKNLTLAFQGILLKSESPWPHSSLKKPPTILVSRLKLTQLAPQSLCLNW